MLVQDNRIQRSPKPLLKNATPGDVVRLPNGRLYLIAVDSKPPWLTPEYGNIKDPSGKHAVSLESGLIYFISITSIETYEPVSGSYIVDWATNQLMQQSCNNREGSGGYHEATIATNTYHPFP